MAAYRECSQVVLGCQRIINEGIVVDKTKPLGKALLLHRKSYAACAKRWPVSSSFLYGPKSCYYQDKIHADT